MIEAVATPRVNANDDRVQLVAWHVNDGDFVELGMPLADVETSKAVVSVDAERSGFVKQLVLLGDIVEVGAPLCLVGDTLAELLEDVSTPATSVSSEPLSVESTESEHPAPSRVPATQLKGFSRLSPAAQRRVAELGIDASRFAGRGLLTLRDIDSALPEGAPKPGRMQPAHTLQTGRSQPLSLAKQAEADALQTGFGSGINSVISVRFDSASIRSRLAQLDLFDGSLQPLILYELARLLPQWPQLNAWCDGQYMHLHDEVRIGLALDLGRGLKVVRLQGTNELLPQQIHEQVQDLAQRYLAQQLRPEELEGSTFSVTDLSGLDVLHFQPLINGRQSAILGIGGDSRLPGQPITLNLAFDHRASNGREGALFLQALRERLLAYGAAEPDEEATDSVGLPLQAALAELRSCDLCGIERQRYYREFGRFAFLHAYVREDSSLGAVCHRCVQGIT